ncbi:HlyD family type I secretion periplasmic adaptor subunit [Caballeronia sp. M1242]|uniref:HlyD family type I secretion periplasmic adaptor subunit n=1 Tax=Caballeronia sp. M1242 TaxID=2814653 RepID=UPI0035300706
MRRESDIPAKLEHELAFQPAHLEIIEKPIHPAPRWAGRAIALLALLIALVTFVGQLDIVATARGKLVPTARVKIIQPALTGVVREIAVRDGERVQEGQMLVRLDATQAAADEEKAKSSRLDAALAVARAQALLGALSSSAERPVVGDVDGAPPERLADLQRQVEGVWTEYSDRLASAHSGVVKRAAEMQGTRSQIAMLEATVPLARAQADDYRALSADQYVARHDYLQREQEAIQQEHDLAVQRSHLRELAAGLEEQRANAATIASQFRREQLDALEKATQALTQGRNDEIKARTREALMSLSAPVAGTVQQLATHTLGGVVTTAQALMEIVPDDALEVEATVENKDIGFVKVGQRAAVKIEAFPYTRYGLLEGEVVSVANDAARDQRQGLVFTARIRLKHNRIQVDDRWIPLTAGMAVTADIATGRQSVAQYFLGPLMEGALEGMHER